MMGPSTRERFGQDARRYHQEEVARLRKVEARYEKVRRLNVVAFKRLYDENITSGVPFDELVDRLP